MNQKPAKLSDNLIDEDSLAQTGHEVVLVDDHQLAQKFFQNNQDALVNPQAVFTNIDALSPQQILVANEIEDINAELRATTLKDVSSQEIALKNLLEEDYQKKKWMRKWIKWKNFFRQITPKFYQPQNPQQVITQDWINYQQLKSDRLRIKDTKKHDFNTYLELMLRNKQQLSKVWSIEIIVSLFYLLIIIGCLVFVAQFSPAYSHNQTTITTAAHQLFNLIIIFCLLSLTLLIIPYFFLFTSFFTGINQIAKAKNFHLFMILFLAIVTVILLVVGCLVISYLAYSFRLWIGG